MKHALTLTVEILQQIKHLVEYSNEISNAEIFAYKEALKMGKGISQKSILYCRMACRFDILHINGWLKLKSNFIKAVKGF